MLPSEMKEYYEVFGCIENSSMAEIKKAYRDKCREFHPDTLASKNLPPEFTDFANRQIQLVNEAYEKIKAHRDKS